MISLLLIYEILIINIKPKVRKFDYNVKKKFPFL